MINDETLTRYIENGVSLDKDLHEIRKTTGFIVSLMGFEKTYKPHEKEAIKKNILEYRKILKAGQYVGLWLYNGLVYVDISRHYSNKQDAIKNGIINKQLAIYDLKNGKDIMLTKKVYILYKYNKILNDINFITEYTSINDMENELKTSYNTLKSYIIKSIDEPIKSLFHDKYIIVSENAFIKDL